MSPGSIYLGNRSSDTWENVHHLLLLCIHSYLSPAFTWLISQPTFLGRWRSFTMVMICWSVQTSPAFTWVIDQLTCLGRFFDQCRQLLQHFIPTAYHGYESVDLFWQLPPKLTLGSLRRQTHPQLTWLTDLLTYNDKYLQNLSGS